MGRTLKNWAGVLGSLHFALTFWANNPKFYATNFMTPSLDHPVFFASTNECCRHCHFSVIRRQRWRQLRWMLLLKMETGNHKQIQITVSVAKSRNMQRVRRCTNRYSEDKSKIRQWENKLVSKLSKHETKPETWNKNWTNTSQNVSVVSMLM